MGIFSYSNKGKNKQPKKVSITESNMGGKNWEDLSLYQKYLITFLALRGLPVTKSDMLSLFKRSRTTFKTSVTAYFINKELQNLIQYDWVEEKRGYFILHKKKDVFNTLFIASQDKDVNLRKRHKDINYYHSISQWTYDSKEKLANYLREFYVAILLDDLELFAGTSALSKSRYSYYSDKTFDSKIAEFNKKLTVVGSNGLFQYLGPNLKSQFLPDIIYSAITDLNSLDFLKDDLNKQLNDRKVKDKSLGDFLSAYYFYLAIVGDIETLKSALSKHPKHPFSYVYTAFIALQNGVLENVEDLYVKGQFSARKEKLSVSGIPDTHIVFFFFLMSVRKLGANMNALNTAIAFYSEVTPSYFPNALSLFEVLVLLSKNKIRIAKDSLTNLKLNTVFEKIFIGHFYYWLQADIPKKQLLQLEEAYEAAKKGGYRWLEMEAAAALSKSSPIQSIKDGYEKKWKTLATELNCVSLLNLIPITKSWERSLMGIEGLFSKETKVGHSRSDKRLVFFANFDKEQPELEIKIQVISTKGGWTAGRKAKYGDLENYMSEPFASAQEKRIFSCFDCYSSYEEDEVVFGNIYYSPSKLYPLLIGFPHLYHLKNTNVPIELEKDEPSIYVEETDDAFKIQLKYLPKNIGANVFKESPTKYRCVDFNIEQFNLLSFFATNDITFPKEVGGRLVDLVKKIEEVMPVESLFEKDLEELTTIEGDTTPHIHLLPTGNTFQIDFFAKPIKDNPRYFHVGAGKNVFTEYVDEEKVVIKRNVQEEIDRTEKVLQLLELADEKQGLNLSWEIDTPEECLKILTIINPLRETNEIVIEWPKGEKLKVVGDLNSNDLDLRISKGKEYWFQLDGEIKVNEHLVFSLQKLLELSENSKNGFVEIDDGQFLSLTSKFQKQLKSASSFLQKGKNDSLEFHNLAGLAFKDLFDDAHLETDTFWEEQQEKLANARNIKPRVSKNFKATLRPYQSKGFKWMMQLAEWGVGGCLADDMGLGKTIQGLAMLTSRKKEGAALVIAPASVCRNWLREAEKFAPDLNPLLFGQGDRAKMLKKLKKGNLIVSSYGLMQTEIENLKEIEFGTIILDEAQAIKNSATKRFKAAIQLNGKFKMATTGTPVENHLGELWSLFQYINPGLLGSKKMFTDRFGKPILNGDKGVMNQLKSLVKPFILRRKKSQVLKDLPSKTEIIYNVEMSLEERAFYEATRRNAIEKLANNLEEQQAGAQHLMILAEITRMRRACCHPSLVDPRTKLPGSKLEAVKEVINDLRENGHKVLVFSQFVGYLKIVENWVQKEKIAYQYLDGSTSMKKRELAVNAFQGGEGDLFLISLKAGGVGLNLTEADYVIILDPWWNPAVEDQAADRAHRIGQKRPVTVYRMVIENTIEEKIVQLHAQKRDLADTLLQGTDSSSKITAKDLMKILKDER